VGLDQAVWYFVQAEIVLKIMISCAPPGICRKDEDMANAHSWGKNVQLFGRRGTGHFTHIGSW
jgi:hypothetical protein